MCEIWPKDWIDAEDEKNDRNDRRNVFCFPQLYFIDSRGVRTGSYAKPLYEESQKVSHLVDVLKLKYEDDFSTKSEKKIREYESLTTKIISRKFEESFREYPSTGNCRCTAQKFGK